jgi:hypothetical protein
MRNIEDENVPPEGYQTRRNQNGRLRRGLAWLMGGFLRSPAALKTQSRGTGMKTLQLFNVVSVQRGDLEPYFVYAESANEAVAALEPEFEIAPSDVLSVRSIPLDQVRGVIQWTRMPELWTPLPGSFAAAIIRS